MGDRTDEMRRYWDERARRNAVWYVDTSTDYHAPDMGRFFATGQAIADEALSGPVAPAGRALAVEIGCGLGRVCQALAARFDAVVGIDLSPEMLSRARELVTFVLGDGAHLTGVADGTADFVVSFTVFQHIPDVDVIDGYLAEAARVLRPGGVVAFQWNNTPGPWRWRVRRRLLTFLQHTGLRPDPYERHLPAFLGSRVPLDHVRSVLEGVGLELRGTRGERTLYAWAWATRPPAQTTARAGP